MTARKFRTPDIVIPALAAIRTPLPGHQLIDVRKLGILNGIAGGERGFNALGDVLTRTTDGTDLNDLWAEFQATLNLQNESRQRIVDFLTFSVTENVSHVPQAGAGVDFEMASEYGEPVGARSKVTYFNMAYDFTWFDIAVRYTWQYLANATAAQVESLHQQVLEADNRNVFAKVMKTVFNNTNLTATIDGNAYNVYKFYNNDGTTPPAYKATTFTNTHTHYYTSGAATLDSADIDAMELSLNEHGYTQGLGYSLVLMVNKAQGDVIRTFRFGVTNNNAAVAKYDFIPARGREDLLFLTQTQVLGNQVAPTLAGLDVLGSYGSFTIIQEDYVPAGYMFAFATGGTANLQNPIGVREHDQASLRGLKLVKGPTPDYPIIDSFYIRGFGTGVRQRGAGVVQQVTASGTYTIPTLYQ
jgi:hypothetical protein